MKERLSTTAKQARKHLRAINNALRESNRMLPTRAEVKARHAFQLWGLPRAGHRVRGSRSPARGRSRAQGRPVLKIEWSHTDFARSSTRSTGHVFSGIFPGNERRAATFSIPSLS